MSIAADLGALEEDRPTRPGQKPAANECITTPDGLVFKDVEVDEPIDTDWSKIFAKFGKSPEHFEIVNDTVSERVSSWQQSKRLENGDRDTVTLYSYRYSAQFRRLTADAISPAVTQSWRDALMADLPATPAASTMLAAAPATYTVFVADPQLGKKGTEQAVENWRNGVNRHLAAIRQLQAAGRGPERIHVAFMGDETEGVCNNYGNQPHTIELNLSRQLELDYDLRVWTLRTLAVAGLPLSASSVISNHGEWTRNGSKDVVTTQGDNASTHIARQVKKLFDELAPFGGPRIDWTIGEGSDPAIIVNLSGVNAYFSHGYIEKGRGTSSETRTRSAMERQILGRTDELIDVPLYFTAHYHHHYSNEFEGRSLIGMPALEAEKSSEYMRNQYGVWSPPGMLGLLVGSHTSRRWSDLSVL
ncbi:hypothetical protein [Rhodococcoides fascians]|uniref:hypothetical protein n=1 Tax=Rhodococcoides fascians TaxID=1828 RepID=UPI000690FD18|nr:hypothetical protein [Rhodococcus fascians]